MAELLRSLRGLLRNPWSTLLGTSALALGIGGATAFFGVLDAAYLRPLPFPQSERLVRLLDAEPIAGGGSYLANMVPRQVDFLARRCRSCELVTEQRGESFTLLGTGDPQQLHGASVSPGSLALLGIAPVLGRGFSAAEEAKGEASGVVVISHSLWRERFGGDPAIVGRALRFDDRIVTVIGVAPSAFHFPYHADVWQPLRLDLADRRDLLVIARLRPGATIAELRDEMAALAPELRRETVGAAAPPGTALPPSATPLREELLREQERASIGLFVAAGLFLAIACANLAGLLIARAAVRRRDFAIRAALGADGWAQARVIFTEPLALALAGCTLAVVALHFAAPALSALVPQVLSEELGFEPVRLSAGVVGFAVAAALVSALLAGLPSALRILRGEVAPLIGSGRAGNLGARHAGLKRLLVAETALLLVLLVGAASLVGSFLRVTGERLGFSPRGLLAIELVAPTSRYADAAALQRLVAATTAEIARLPGTRAAVSTVNPLRGGTWGASVRKPQDPSTAETEVNLRLVSPGFLATLGAPLLRGRDIEEIDAGGPPSVVVSRRLAQRLWGREDVLGEQLVRGTSHGAVSAAVVGVADDVADAGDLRETIYVPYAQFAGTPGANDVWILARSAGPNDAWVRDVERALWRIDPQLAWSDLGWMDSMRSASIARERLGTRIAALFAAFALLLAGLGLGSVMSFVLSQREREIGVRQALGAAPGRLRLALTLEGVRLAAIGVAIGWPAYWAVRPLLAHWVPALDSPSLAIQLEAIALILLVALTAAYLSARRALRMDPIAALREG